MLPVSICAQSSQNTQFLYNCWRIFKTKEENSKDDMTWQQRYFEGKEEEYKYYYLIPAPFFLLKN